MGYKLVSSVVGFSDANVNGKTTGATVVFTTLDSTKLFFPYRIRIYLTNPSGVVTPPTISVGTNASSYNNMLAATALTGLTTSGTYLDFPIISPVTALAAGVDVNVNVTVGANATTYGFRVAVYGDTL